ncbi:MAG: hypothetical protein HGGPFJEG_02765 [Ignavibacteria bacterium]|nr:hypothetical protein [Ignavibacteria bacterium]
MIQKDYFMKIAEMLSAVIARMVLKKDLKKFDEAENELEEASMSIAGMDMKLIKLFSAEDLIKLVKTSDLFAGKCIASAELLYEYGKLKEETGILAESADSYLKSFRLFIEAVLSKDLPDNAPYIKKIEELLLKINPETFSGEMYLQLLDYFALTNRFSKFEDTAFEFMNYIEENDTDLDLEKAFLKITNFYNKLKSLPEEELLKGNLSKTEVEESLEEILIFKNKKL